MNAIEKIRLVLTEVATSEVLDQALCERALFEAAALVNLHDLNPETLFQDEVIKISFETCLRAVYSERVESLTQLCLGIAA